MPKSLPFYDKVIQEAEEAKEARERRREEAKLLRRQQRDQIIAKKREIGYAETMFYFLLALELGEGRSKYCISHFSVFMIQYFNLQNR